PIAPDPHGYPGAPLPAALPAASAASLMGRDPLGSPATELDAGETTGYAAEVDEPLSIYRDPGALAHPGQLLQQANRALSQHVALGPWIHAGSRIAHCGVARLGDQGTTRGRVGRVFERKGHEFVRLDLP